MEPERKPVTLKEFVEIQTSAYSLWLQTYGELQVKVGELERKIEDLNQRFEGGGKRQRTI